MGRASCLGPRHPNNSPPLELQAGSERPPPLATGDTTVCCRRAREKKRWEKAQSHARRYAQAARVMQVLATPKAPAHATPPWRPAGHAPATLAP
jgi:hypothetical protein